MPNISPFENERESLSIGELTIENRLDQVSLYGSLQLTKDQAGLVVARQLQAVLNAVVTALERAGTLPEKIPVAARDYVSNPLR